MVEKKVINRVIVMFLFAILLILSFILLKPILLAIVLGVFIAYILHPLYVPLSKKIKNKNLSTLIFIVLICIVIAVPIWFFMPYLLKEIFDTYLYVQRTDLSGAITQIISLFLSEEMVGTVSTQVNVWVAKFFSFSMESFSGMFSDIPNLLFQISVFIFTFYFAIRDSEKIKEYISELSPLSRSTEDKFAAEFRSITNSIVFGQILTGVIQGLFLGLGLWILGVPKVFFLTIIAIIVSIIPIIGAWLVWIPASLFMIISGNVINGTILFFYGLLFVSTIDNFLRPYLISKKSNIHLFVAIIGTIGGLYTFGIVGLIIGPLVLSYVLIVVDFYRQGKLNELFKE